MITSKVTKTSQKNLNRGTSLVVGSAEELIHGLASAIISIGHQVRIRPVDGLNRVVFIAVLDRHRS